MDLTGIIAISGKPGLFKVIAQGKNSIIVESLIDNKRVPAYATDRISSLDDISIYTYDDDAPLKDVFVSIFKKEGGKECPSHKEDLEKLKTYLIGLLPNFDQERVYPSDIKKIFQWYNLLLKADLLKVEEEKKEKKEAKGEKKATTAEKKEKAETKEKKPAAKKASTAKPKADSLKAKAAKPVAAKKATATKTGTSRGK